ncbi:thymidylate kinase [Armillaria mellea]|nr:thymidylate kinase [Armillaria mellea]
MTETVDLQEKSAPSRNAVKLHKFPDRTTSIGEMINSYLQRTEIRINIDLLELGATVLCDRYTFSGIAFTASKGLPYECRSPDVDMPATDLVVTERREKEEIQQRVREQCKIIESENVVQWATIDAGGKGEQVGADILGGGTLNHWLTV